MTQLKKLIKEIHKNARQKGFYEKEEVITTLMSSMKFSKQHAIKPIRDAFLSQKLFLVNCEVSEAGESIRNNNYGLEKKDTFEDEIADSIIRLLDICGYLDIDIEKQIKWKMKYNSKRKKLHGKEF